MRLPEASPAWVGFALASGFVFSFSPIALMGACARPHPDWPGFGLADALTVGQWLDAHEHNRHLRFGNAVHRGPVSLVHADSSHCTGSRCLNRVLFLRHRTDAGVRRRPQRAGDHRRREPQRASVPQPASTLAAGIR